MGVRPDNPVARILMGLQSVPAPLLDSFSMVGARALPVA
jgi:hypothetical protein